MQSRRLIHLTSPKVSVVFSIDHGQISVAYWGEKLHDPIAKDNPEIFYDSFNFNELDNPENPGFWRENSRGWPGITSVQGHHNGKNFSPHFKIVDVQNSENKIEIRAVDSIAKLQVMASFELDFSGLLIVGNSVTNLSDSQYQLNSLSTWLPLPSRASEVMSFTGRWVKERQMQRHRIPVGVFARESRDGRSGHDATITLLGLTQNCDFQNGEAWSCALSWSGNTKHQIERLAIGQQSIGAEELLLPGEMILSQNETYHSPKVIFGYSNQGLDGLTNQHYQWLRNRKTHPTKIKPRPVTLNVWEAIYFDHDLKKLIELADVAQDIGVERFVLDDGWFNFRRNDFAGLGDWWVDTAIWPTGLHELIAEVKSRKMEFGLWFEPEMVNPDSELYRNHPGWILQSGGRVPPEQRHQLVLNIANPEVFGYLFEKINSLLSEYQIDYIKWDHNRVLIEPGFNDQAVVNAQTKAFYRLLEEIKQAHPGLEIESCASGGARIDLGAIDHVDRFWTSDCNEALERNFIQRWTGIVIPPEMLGTHIGPPKSHTTGRTHNLSFRGVTALFGHAGIEWDITKASDDERVHLENWITYYKNNRDLLHSGDVVRIIQPDDAIWVHGVVNSDKTKGIFSIAHLAAVSAIKPPLLRLAGLNPEFNYRVELIQPAGPAETIQNKTPQWVAGSIISGDVLLRHGLRGEKIQPENAYLIEFTAVN